MSIQKKLQNSPLLTNDSKTGEDSKESAHNNSIETRNNSKKIFEMSIQKKIQN